MDFIIYGWMLQLSHVCHLQDVTEDGKCFWHMSTSASGFKKHISNIPKNLKLNMRIHLNILNAR
jgi:hypothetical protein